MGQVLTEGINEVDVFKLLQDGPKRASFEQVTVLAGQILALGAVIGKITKATPTTGTKNDANTGAGTMTAVTAGQKAQIGTYTISCLTPPTTPATPATAAPFTHNTGDGVMGAVAVGATAKVGVYTLEFMKVAGNLGNFIVRYPDGSFCGQGVVATEFVGGGLTFTLADGNADYIVGDGFTLTVAAATAGTGGTWEVKTPSGERLADLAAVGTPYTSEHLNFTLNDSGANFIAGDSFTVAVAAGSGKVKAIAFSAVDGSQDAYGILFKKYDTTDSTFKSRAFTSGGTYETRPGDIVVGATSAATASVVSVTLSSGTFAGGDAAGTLILDNQVGTFESENLNVGTNANVATIGGDSSAYTPDLAGVAVVREAVIDPDNLTWPTGATDAQKATALAQLSAKNILTRDAA